MSKSFSKNHTNMVKGVAVMLLLFHHLFYKLEYFDNCYMHSEKWVDFLHKIASNSKVCVALFLLLSGYGLMKSADKLKSKITLRFSALHICKVLMMLWFIYILFVPLGYAFDRTFTDIYGTGKSSIFYFFTDLAGLTSKANETWWYMREIIFLYIIFPFLYYPVKKCSVLSLAVCLLFGHWGNYHWLVPFVLGMICAEKNIFGFILNQKGIKRVAFAVLGLIVMYLSYKVRAKYYTEFDAFFALSIVCFLISVVNIGNIFSKALEFMGEHSANIFMFHTFIYSKYFRDYIYWFKYPLLIFLVLLIVCLIVSFGIEKLKKLVRYDKLGKLLSNIINFAFDKWDIFLSKIDLREKNECISESTEKNPKK